ncbi:MAG: mannose-1-phosphate guanylyltransferase [Bacteriovoracaceae bacterium]|jgi:mannose-1-phosphate guanylyltransferase|nr:mannose-1-phosphate guanylyltransferase [Bacteriovoracaceae bacterium]
MKAIVMCGGSGTRLWPLSRKSTPKQFIKMFNNKSLFELTLERNFNLVDEFIIVVNDAQLELCQKQTPKILQDKVTYIVEPIGRNTAPVITMAGLISKTDFVLVLPSDHLIHDQQEYENCIHQAKELAQEKNLVTFGIKPTYPETGYGYIQADGNSVISFKEKPQVETAKKYLEAGNYFWNSGMFLFSNQTFLEEIEKYSPEIYQFSKQAILEAPQKNNIFKIEKEQMLKIPSNSIDYAVMEKSTKVKVIESKFNWSDLGSFDSLYDELDKDENNNTVDSHYVSINSKNNLIHGQKRYICTYDVDDLIIIDTEDALLIGKRGASQKVKELLQKIKTKDPLLLE